MLEMRAFLLSLLKANDVKWTGCGSEFVFVFVFVLSYY